MRPLMMKRLVKTQVVVDPASATGEAIAQTVESFGFQPKRVLQSPNLVANAMAFPDGTVFFTTAARALMTDAELAAVLAHELSHVKHRDAKKIERIKALCMLIPSLVAALVIFGLLQFGGADVAFDYVFAFLACLIVSTSSFVVAILGRFSRRIEFRCDQEAAVMGHGAALASGLVKLHQYGGAPLRWGSLDRLILTHPSLEDRLVALGHPYRAAVSE